MRILLLEDEPKIARVVERSLRAERYVVDLASDGSIALALFTNHSYDLILLDLLVPELSGMEVVKRIRRSDALVPILVVTARDSIDYKVKLFKLGVDDYLTKPFAIAELIARVKALLRRTSASRCQILHVDDLVFNLWTRQVERRGRNIILTPTELALLEYLMQNPDNILSRSMIIGRVWDESFEGVSNIVDVYIRNLRRKIDALGEVKLICTIKGQGYMIRSNVGR